ncbi:hypothetical protein M3A49_39805 [Paraburkholderia sp. CNPSo 3076]|uniref:hypothetical protein n=1 Tax=Paraburkholderia sp. CNPSo 3076 TaxID=2940936 RepID=UPI002255E02F|nr:hypothetical protein [Paraburkholderia sp. CNPSo 3076]MCX5545504.1 hypothetical protein [Paraburkholderia sp. CNPSo 3076]
MSTTGSKTATPTKLTADDVERQYRDAVHIGSGLPRATCPCGFCAKHRHGFDQGDASCAHDYVRPDGVCTECGERAAPTRRCTDNSVCDETALPDWNEAPPEADAQCGLSPKPSRQRAARLRATIATARLDLLKLPPSNERTGVLMALDDAELLAREVIDNPVPDSVRAALERMCTPLDKSWLSGATAEADARCMKVIRDYVLGSEASGG